MKWIKMAQKKKNCISSRHHLFTCKHIYNNTGKIIIVKVNTGYSRFVVFEIDSFDFKQIYHKMKTLAHVFYHQIHC